MLPLYDNGGDDENGSNFTEFTDGTGVCGVGGGGGATKHNIFDGRLPCNGAAPLASRFLVGAIAANSLDMSLFGQLHTLKCINFLPSTSCLF